MSVTTEIYFNKSSGGAYVVQVESDATQVHALRCDCPAGSFAQLCKHLKAFFESNSAFLHRPDQHEVFRSFCLRLKNSPANDDHNRLQADIRHYDDMDVTAQLKAAFVQRLRGVR
jgi:hypothetical protein